MTYEVNGSNGTVDIAGAKSLVLTLPPLRLSPEVAWDIDRNAVNQKVFAKAIREAFAEQNGKQSDVTSPHVKNVIDISDDVSEPVVDEATTKPKGKLPLYGESLARDNAAFVIRMYGRDIRYLSDVRENKWIVWNATKWDRNELEIRRLCVQAIDDLAVAILTAKGDEKKSLISRWGKAQSSAHIESVKFYAALGDGIAIGTKKLDMNPWLFNCTNGTIDLRSGVLHPPRREDYITQLCPIAYKPGAAAPLFEKLLKEMFAPYPDVISWLIRLFGYCLTGSIREQIFPVFYGPTGTGKTTLFETIRDTMGDDYATTARASSFLKKDNNRFSLSSVVHRRFVQISETDEGQELSEALLKNIAGDDKGVAERKYEHEFEFESTCKVILRTNHKPILSGDDAIWRRVVAIPCVVSFLTNPDKALKDKLKTEREGILALLVRGAGEWYQRGLGDLSISMRKAKDAYRSEVDPFHDYENARLEFAPAFNHVTDEVYADYRKWCGDREIAPLEQPKFTKELRLRHGVISKSYGNIRRYVGVRLQGSVQSIIDEVVHG